MEILAQAAFDGMVVGAMIGLAALGLTFIWGVERFSNIAQGDTLTVAAYAALGVASLGVPLVVSAGVSIVITVAIVLATERFAFRRLAAAPRIALLVASIGVSLVYRGVVSLLFTTRLQGYDISPARAITLGFVRVSPLDIVIVATVALALAFVYGVLYRTRTGIEMRAVADLRDLARVSGIKTQRVIQVTWAVSAAVSAVAGILLAAKLGLTPLIGWNILLAAFAATVLGSIGNPVGAVVGGIAIGVITETSAVVLSPTYKQAVAFVILALLLLVRPRGLFPRS